MTQFILAIIFVASTLLDLSLSISVGALQTSTHRYSPQIIPRSGQIVARGRSKSKGPYTDTVWSLKDNIRLVVLNPIGAGNFGSVYKADYQVGKNAPVQHVVAKILNCGQTTNELAYLGNRLVCRYRNDDQNRNTVRVFAVTSLPPVKDVSQTVVIMTRIPTGRLLDRINDKLFWLKSDRYRRYETDNRRIRDAITQIATGLKYLHKKGIFHHDLKADNVLYDYDSEPDSRYQISDFDLASDELWSRNNRLGAWPIRSPGQYAWNFPTAEY
jgi:serine/threonine protein kinase